MQSVSGLVARAYARYVVPLTLLSAIAFAPLLFFALKAHAPVDVAAARGVVRTGWMLAILGLAPMLLLVGVAAPMVRGLVDGAPAGQLGALRAGIAGGWRALVPCAFALLAIGVGLVAVVVPGLVLLVLLAPAGAFAAPERSTADALAEAVSAARARFVPLIVVVGVTVAAVTVALLLLQRQLPPPAKTLAPAQLAMFPLFVRYAVGGLALVAPLPAVMIATLTSLTARPTPRA